MPDDPFDVVARHGLHFDHTRRSPETALQLRKPALYELDDDVFVTPPGTPGSDYPRDPARLTQLEH